MAKTIVRSATWALTPIDRRQLAAPRKRWYQRSDRKGGGKLRYSAPLNETITMMTTGAIRNRSTAAATRHHRHRARPGALAVLAHQPRPSKTRSSLTMRL